MLYPRNGKVVIIDDVLEEALPLMKLLRSKNVSTLYYSGRYDELPAEPLNDVRLVFCDLKFNPAEDSKSVIANIHALLNKIIGDKNGPFIFIIWSTREEFYFDELKKALSTSKTKPESVLQLKKSDYFYSVDNSADFMERVKEKIANLSLDVGEEKAVVQIIETEVASNNKIVLLPIDNALEKIEERLTEELKKVNLFHLFVIWENTIRSSALETVNTIFREVPDTIPPDKRLNAMLYYLAYNRLEKALNDADVHLKFWAVKDSINELFSYFYDENVQKISESSFDINDIQAVVDEIQKISSARFNRWRMISVGEGGINPGTVYEDSDKMFECQGMVFDYSKYDDISTALKHDPDVKYIYVDASSECDNAQGKRFNVRIIPGLMIPVSKYEQWCDEKKFKKGSGIPNYICVWREVEDMGKDWVIVFNTNQIGSIAEDKLDPQKKLWALTKSYINYLKQLAANNISRQGIGIFKKK